MSVKDRQKLIDKLDAYRKYITQRSSSLNNDGSIWTHWFHCKCGTFEEDDTILFNMIETYASLRGFTLGITIK